MVQKAFATFLGSYEDIRSKTPDDIYAFLDDSIISKLNVAALSEQELHDKLFEIDSNPQKTSSLYVNSDGKILPKGSSYVLTAAYEINSPANHKIVCILKTGNDPL